MFLNISLQSKDKWLVFVITVVSAILVIAIVIMIDNIDRIKNGDLFKGELDLSFKQYYLQADMTVISNKNINTYAVKEWHKEGEYTKLEYLDYMKNKVVITLEKNKCSISNSGNTAKFVMNNMLDNKNIASLSTFAELYNNHTEQCKCSKEKRIKDNETIIIISFIEGCQCDCQKITQELKITTLKLILVNNVPKNYIILDENKKEYISIVYNVFENNIDI